MARVCGGVGEDKELTEVSKSRIIFATCQSKLKHFEPKTDATANDKRWERTNTSTTKVRTSDSVIPTGSVVYASHMRASTAGELKCMLSSRESSLRATSDCGRRKSGPLPPLLRLLSAPPPSVEPSSRRDLPSFSRPIILSSSSWKKAPPPIEAPEAEEADPPFLSEAQVPIECLESKL